MKVASDLKVSKQFSKPSATVIASSYWQSLEASLSRGVNIFMWQGKVINPEGERITQLFSKDMGLVPTH